MTESEWLASTNPAVVLGKISDSFRARKASLDRKILLHFSAALHHVEGRLPDEWLTLLGVVDDYLAGQASGPQLAEAALDIAPHPLADLGNTRDLIVLSLVQLGRRNLPLDLYFAQCTQVLLNPLAGDLLKDHAAFCCWLVREVFGNPFRASSSPFLPAPLPEPQRRWNDGAVPALARSISETADFSLMPILADALEEAGYQGETLLEHLRGPARHSRSCWALERVLGLS